MRNFLFSLLILFSCCCFSCKQKPTENAQAHHPEETNEAWIARTKVSFKSVLGIHFTEVYRRFDNGVSFNKQGFQLKPDWKMYFLSDTTFSLYSLIKKRYFDLPVTLDHDSVFSASGAWFKAKVISKDSLLFQVLYVHNKVIDWKNSNVYVTFYPEDYIKNVLHTTEEKLRETTKKDTAFIQALADASARDPKKLFEAQHPVVLKSTSPNVTVTNAKLKGDKLSNYYVPETLFYPEYSITIHKAYADFYHTFAVQVDAKGQMHFVEPMEAAMDEDDQQHTIKIMKGIMDGYLTHYLAVTPGKTLDIPHDTQILLVVRGYKD